MSLLADKIDIQHISINLKGLRCKAKESRRYSNRASHPGRNVEELLKSERTRGRLAYKAVRAGQGNDGITQSAVV